MNKIKTRVLQRSKRTESKDRSTLYYTKYLTKQIVMVFIYDFEIFYNFKTYL